MRPIPKSSYNDAANLFNSGKSVREVAKKSCTVSLPETEEFSVESAPVESAPVVRLVRRRANN
ncbi:hypothetical protein MFLAVUS_011471 [Mucor flavus]|uniref:Uncharacterized protein n=1 Tax=Mucor flavus TaxID=439312 RepID=A0ABP9ZFJ4_9FUNG